MGNQIDELMTLFVRDPGLHARWLNTLSLLEHIGFRKIVKSQKTQWLDEETMSHCAEEAQHALLLKRLAMNVGGPAFARFDADVLLCGDEARAYFQGLDADVASVVTSGGASGNPSGISSCSSSGSSSGSVSGGVSGSAFGLTSEAGMSRFLREAHVARLTYLYVTWLIEVRALAVYRSYTKALAREGKPDPLTNLLSEESGHLSLVARSLRHLDPRFAIRSKQLQKMEAASFDAFLQALRAAVDSTTHHSRQESAKNRFTNSCSQYEQASGTHASQPS